MCSQTSHSRFQQLVFIKVVFLGDGRRKCAFTMLLQYKWVFYDYLSQIYVDPTLRSLRRHSFHSLENSVPSISASTTAAAATSQNSWCYLRSRRQKCFKVLTKPCLSDMLLLNFSLWNEITFCIHCSPVAGLSGCMYIRFGISGSAFPATIHRLKTGETNVMTVLV